MFSPALSLLILFGSGVLIAGALARRFAPIDPERMARAYLVGVTTLTALRVAVWVASRVFGLQALLPFSNVPYDPTNLLIGAFYGLAALNVRRGGFSAFLGARDVQTAFRVATGAAFVLAGLASIITMYATRRDFFSAFGYSTPFHLLMITAEVLGGAALLLPWPWLTLLVAAALTIDMFGALYSVGRVAGTVEPAAVTMLLRLAPLALLTTRGRWVPVAVSAVACVVVALVGAALMLNPATP